MPQSKLRKKFIQFGEKKLVKSNELLKGKKFSKKGAGKRFARLVTEAGGYKVPTQLKDKPMIKPKKKKRRVKKIVYYKR